MGGQGERDRCQPQRSPLRIRIVAITAGLVLQIFALGELAEDLLCSNLVGHEEYIAEQEDRAPGSPTKIRAARDVGNNSHARIPTPDPKSWFRLPTGKNTVRRSRSRRKKRKLVPDAYQQAVCLLPAFSASIFEMWTGYGSRYQKSGTPKTLVRGNRVPRRRHMT